MYSSRYSASFVSKEEIPADQYALRLGGNHEQVLSFHLLFLVVLDVRGDFFMNMCLRLGKLPSKP